MFEKDAEERVKDYIIKSRDCLMQPCKTLEDCQDKELEFDEVVKLVKDGAEFGYHEGFKDCAKSRLNITTISDSPIKDDWHDLEKDPNDLPKHTNSVLAYCRGDYYDVCFFNGKRLIGHGESDFLKWKEIE